MSTNSVTGKRMKVKYREFRLLNRDCASVKQENRAKSSNRLLTMNQSNGNVFNNKSEAIAVAVKRKGANLQLVSLGEVVKYFVKESALNQCGIQLGDICTFKLQKDVPTNFQKVAHPSGMRFIADEDSTRGENIYGTLVKINGALFFRTREFGNVAYLDYLGSSVPIDQEYSIVVRLLEEDEQVAAYSKCIWGAEIDRNPDKSSSKLPDFQNLKISDDTESISENGSSSEDQDDSTRTVTGIVLEKCKDADNSYKVWTRESYSGTDGVLRNDGNTKINPGDWVTLYFTKEEYDIHFPMQKSNRSPPFKTEKFRKMRPFYTITFTAQNVMQLVIRRVEFGEDHKLGDDLTDPIIGLIADEQKAVPNGAGCYDLTIRLIRSFCKNTEEVSRWKVIKATKPEINPIITAAQKKSVKTVKRPKFEKDKRTALNFAKPNKTGTKSNDFKNKGAKKVVNKPEMPKKECSEGSSQFKSNTNTYPNNTQMFGPQHMMSPMWPTVAPMMQNFPGQPPMYYPIPNYMPPMSMANQPLGGMPYPHPMVRSNMFPNFPNSSQMKPPQPQRLVKLDVKTDQTEREKEAAVTGRGFENKNGTEDVMKIKTTAVVMTIRRHAKDAVTYFLWLLEEHQQAAFNTTLAVNNLKVGHFFEGAFKRKSLDDKWNCVKYCRSAGKIMDGEKYQDTVQLKIVVDKFFPANKAEGENYPKTWHKYFGPIVDNKNKLTSNCFGGVQIVVRMAKVDDKFVWVVIQNMDTPQTKLVREFGTAWTNPQIRDIVNRSDPMGYKKLKKNYSK